MRVIYETFTCKFCGSSHVVRYGLYRGVQRLFCKDCKRKFAATDALPYMHTPAPQVASAINAYYEGDSLQAARRQLQADFGNLPSDSTVYRWVHRFTKEAIRRTKDIHPQVGTAWVADETMLEIGGKQVWFWDVMDVKTRFLLASHMSTTRTTKDAKTVMEAAAQRAEKKPKVVLTDKLAAYTDGIEQAFGADTEHIAVKGLTAEINNNLIERFHSTLKTRERVFRGLKTRDSVLLDGWLIHYNYIRPHEALGDRTPAEAAKVDRPFDSWKGVVIGSASKDCAHTSDMMAPPIRIVAPASGLIPAPIPVLQKPLRIPRDNIRERVKRASAPFGAPPVRLPAPPRFPRRRSVL